MTFDLRPYCERLAKACPDRFEMKVHNTFWALSDRERYWNEPEEDPYLAQLWSTESERYVWRFFGPLADERKIETMTVVDPWNNASDPQWCEYPILPIRKKRTWLESLVAAVVESFEMKAGE